MNTDGILSLLPMALVLTVLGLFWIKVRRDARRAAELPPVLVGAPIPEYRGLFAFFRKHYNGDYMLARSYWVNTLLVSLFAPVFGFMLLPWLNENFPARYGSAGFLFVTAFGVCAWFWAVAGTWASANKHVQRGGQSGWATAAKVMIVLGVLRTFGDVGNMTPALLEHMKIAMGAQVGTETKLEVRADKQSILLTGGINDGSAEQLEKALQMAPSVTTVVLNSEGGWIREGQMLANVIRKRGLNTYVEGYCASACTIAFLAGNERAAAPTAKIGFHASRSIGSMVTKPNSAETSKLRTIYSEAHLPDSFIRQAIETPHAKMWYPSNEELLSAGVFTRKSLGGETAALSTTVQSKESLATEFRKTELFAALAERSPKDFDDIIEASWKKVQQGVKDAEVIAAARAQLGIVLQRYFPLASDETLIEYQKLMQEQLEALRAKDSLACAEMVFPSGKPMLVVGNMPQDLRNREGNLTTKMLKEADAKRAIKSSPKDSAQIAQRSFAGMTPDQLKVFSDEGARKLSSSSLVCEAAIKFFSNLNSIPLADRGRSLRIIYANGQ